MAGKVNPFFQKKTCRKQPKQHLFDKEQELIYEKQGFIATSHGISTDPCGVLNPPSPQFSYNPEEDILIGLKFVQLRNIRSIDRG